MIYQGLFNILDLHIKESEAFYSNIDNFFQKVINNINFSRKDLDNSLDKVIKSLTNKLLELGFSQEEIENKFLDSSIYIRDDEKKSFNSLVDLYNIKISPIIYEIFLEKIVDYLVDSSEAPLILQLKSKGILHFEVIMELQRLKNLLEKNPEKIANLRKYIHIRDKIIHKFSQHKCEIESLENIQDPQDKLQLIYMIYRIIRFFNLERMFEFLKIKEYLKENIDEWLQSVPLVTLRNPDLYFCGLYLSKALNIEFDEEKVKNFLLETYSEIIDEFDAAIIEATDQIYYFFKSIELIDLNLSESKLETLIKADASFFEKHYLMNLETSQLVVILKLYNVLGLINKIDTQKINAIKEEIDRRITPEGINQFRDGIISSEATYYVLFSAYMDDKLNKLKDHDILESVVSRIYRNLEITDFCTDTNYDLVSEIFYSCECLKLFNCIESKEMIYHMAKYLFPDDILKNGFFNKNIDRATTKFRHYKVNKISGDTIH
ncbi:MAG: hypothetical protein KGD63_11700 [Candidatus Lokiarchaeota archaeon]|nr:hypothetical protein [Candidatus Lokiarchaeota archaeon]